MENLHLNLENFDENQRKFNSFVFIPYENGLFKNAAEQKTTRTENQISFVIEPTQFRTKKPDSVKGIVVMQGSSSIQAYEIKIPIAF